MKKLLPAFGAAHAEEIYDPQHTMLALNMAIVSVHRILTTQDRIILEQEYQNIINNLSLGNIESDKDMTALYSDLTGIISRKRLRSEEAEFLRSHYDQRERNLMNKALSRIRPQGKKIISIIASFAVSCVSSYFEYRAMKSELSEELRGELWQLTKEDITDCNNLQERLLNSSWNLLRQYGLPDSYRLVQRMLDDFYKAVNEKDPAKRFRMLRAVERDFQVYPPYWMYRGKTAQALGNNSEAHSCFERFSEVWRPVLRQDPYKVEALKFGLSEIVKDGNISDEDKRRAFGILEDMTVNTPRDDWANKLFAGVAYFLLGDKDRGIKIVESNVDFGYGADVSGAVLAQLKKGKLNPEMLPSDIAGQLTAQMKDQQLAEVLTAYFEGLEDEAEKALESMSGTSENPIVFFALVLVNTMKNNSPKADMFLKKMVYLYGKDKEAGYQAFAEVKPLLEFYAEKQVPSAQTFLGLMYDAGFGVKEDKEEAVKWYRKAAEQGIAEAQFTLGKMYSNGEGVPQDKSEAVKWYRKAAEQGYAAAQFVLGVMYNNGEGVKEDKAEAVKWYRKAAEQGNAAAQINLGNMYYNGEGVKEDKAEAVKWYRKAAEQGHASAQCNLGTMYYSGEGVTQDYKTAYMWYYLASLNGNRIANGMLWVLEKAGWFSSAKVSPSRAEEAKAEARRKYDEIRKRYGLE